MTCCSCSNHVARLYKSHCCKHDNDSVYVYIRVYRTGANGAAQPSWIKAVDCHYISTVRKIVHHDVDYNLLVAVNGHFAFLFLITSFCRYWLADLAGAVFEAAWGSSCGHILLVTTWWW